MVKIMAVLFVAPTCSSSEHILADRIAYHWVVPVDDQQWLQLPWKPYVVEAVDDPGGVAAVVKDAKA